MIQFGEYLSNGLKPPTSCSFGWIRMVETSTHNSKRLRPVGESVLLEEAHLHQAFKDLGELKFEMSFYVDRWYVEDKLMLFYSKCFRWLFGLTVFFFGGGAEHKEFGWLKDMVDRRQFIGARTFVKPINHFRLKFPGAIATWERKIVEVYATKHWLVGWYVFLTFADPRTLDDRVYLPS